MTDLERIAEILDTTIFDHMQIMNDQCIECHIDRVTDRAKAIAAIHTLIEEQTKDWRALADSLGACHGCLRNNPDLQDEYSRLTNQGDNK
jgi:hypothetical protein